MALTEESEALLSPADCARRAAQAGFPFTREQVVRRIEQGLIEAEVIAGRVLVRGSALEKFLRQQKSRPA